MIPVLMRSFKSHGMRHHTDDGKKSRASESRAPDRTAPARQPQNKRNEIKKWRKEEKELQERRKKGGTNVDKQRTDGSKLVFMKDRVKSHCLVYVYFYLFSRILNVKAKKILTKLLVGCLLKDFKLTFKL